MRFEGVERFSLAAAIRPRITANADFRAMSACFSILGIQKHNTLTLFFAHESFGLFR
jgi:hypothetical protein